MNQEELRRKKNEFLARYNSHRSTVQAESDAIKSAVQHNSLYAPGVGERDRVRVGIRWKQLLNDLAAQYKSSVSITKYEADIGWLCEQMNTQFGVQFRSDRHPKFDYDPGFRISHAQKSLSVFLKHLWCLESISMPPQCPIDSRILEATGVRYPRNRWTHVNTIEEHRAQIAMLTACAKKNGLPLSEWELVTFSA